MKQLVREIVFGRNSLISGAIALCIVLSIALGCNCNKNFDLANMANSNSGRGSDTGTSTEGPPPNAEVQSLIKGSLREFRDAVDSGDFSQFYNDASEDFRNTYTRDQVEGAFKTYTDKKKFVVPILDKAQGTDIEWDHPAGIRTEKRLNILTASGKFSTKPYNVRVDTEYVNRGGEWKLLKFVINIP